MFRITGLYMFIYDSFKIISSPMIKIDFIFNGARLNRSDQ